MGSFSVPFGEYAENAGIKINPYALQQQQAQLQAQQAQVPAMQAEAQLKQQQAQELALQNKMLQQQQAGYAAFQQALSGGQNAPTSAAPGAVGGPQPGGAATNAPSPAGALQVSGAAPPQVSGVASAAAPPPGGVPAQAGGVPAPTPPPAPDINADPYGPMLKALDTAAPQMAPGQYLTMKKAIQDLRASDTTNADKMADVAKKDLDADKAKQEATEAANKALGGAFSLIHANGNDPHYAATILGGLAEASSHNPAAYQVLHQMAAKALASPDAASFGPLIDPYYQQYGLPHDQEAALKKAQTSEASGKGAQSLAEAAKTQFEAKKMETQAPVEAATAAATLANPNLLSPEQQEKAREADVAARAASVRGQAEMLKATTEANKFKMEFGGDAVKGWAASISQNPDGVAAVPPAMRTAVMSQFTKDTGLPWPKPLTGAAVDTERQARTVMDGLDRVNAAIQDPEIQSRLGPILGRLGNVEQDAGSTVGLSPSAAAKAQELRTNLRYMMFGEGKAILGGRLPQQLMSQLEKTSPNITMSGGTLQGALQGVQDGALRALDTTEQQRFGGKMRSREARGITPVKIGISGKDATAPSLTPTHTLNGRPFALDPKINKYVYTDKAGGAVQ